MEANLVTVFFQRRWRDHRRCRVGENIDKRRERLLEGDFHRLRIDNFGLINVLVQVIALEVAFWIAGAIEVDLHRLGVEISAILEFDALAQLDGIDFAIVRHRVAFRQHVLQLHLFIQAEQPLIEGFRHRLRQRVVSVIRVEGGEVGAYRHHHIFGRERGSGGQR